MKNKNNRSYVLSNIECQGETHWPYCKYKIWMKSGITLCRENMAWVTSEDKEIP
jgi:hypothetical protein